jgi:pimeloyl-ACP methyl ester carboxylesterase
LKSVEYADRLPTIKVPTSFGVGNHDECDPALSQETHSLIQGSKLVILPYSGHMTFDAQHVLWHEAVAGFLQPEAK